MVRNLPSWDVILGAAETYLQYCDCQPLPLFQRSSFIRTLKDRRPEVLLSILAIALRLTEDQQSRNNHARLTTGYVEAARTIVSKQVFEGAVELSTIQALCLLTIVDFTGKILHISSHLSNIRRWPHKTSEYPLQSGHEPRPQRRPDIRIKSYLTGSGERRAPTLLLELISRQAFTRCRFYDPRLFCRGQLSMVSRNDWRTTFSESGIKPRSK